MTELTFPKELMLTRQANQKSVIFVTTGIIWIKGLKFQPDVCHDGCHDLLRISMNLSDTVGLSTNGADYCCIFSGISKSQARNSMQKIDLTEKSGRLQTMKFIITYKNG